ncbi:unnamed protein product, partial [Amoebophrya sp. A120]
SVASAVAENDAENSYIHSWSAWQYLERSCGETAKHSLYNSSSNHSENLQDSTFNISTPLLTSQQTST